MQLPSEFKCAGNTIKVQLVEKTDNNTICIKSNNILLIIIIYFALRINFFPKNITIINNCLFIIISDYITYII